MLGRDSRGAREEGEHEMLEEEEGEC